MYETFFSLVVPVSDVDSQDDVIRFLEAVGREIATAFTDYELILVDNGCGFDFSSLMLDEHIRSNCYIVKLARKVVWDHAVLAGLERANGDYSASFDVRLADHLNVIKKMYEAAVYGSDVVYLRDRHRSKARRSLRRSLFFWALQVSGAGQVNPRDRREMLISRRALNWIVRDQSAHWYLNDAFLSSGFNLHAIEVDLPAFASPRTSSAASDQAWSTLVRSSRFLGLVASAVIGGLLIVLVLVVLNTLMVRIIGRDLLWQTQSAVPGWTYTVLLLAGGFAGIAVLLYVVLRVQLVLLEELGSRPRYVVEHFGRI